MNEGEHEVEGAIAIPNYQPRAAEQERQTEAVVGAELVASRAFWLTGARKGERG